MKKYINAPADIVREAMEGFGQAHSGLVKAHFDPNFVTRAIFPAKPKVALLSGGGSGHEPMHSGYVGEGMLDAACPGAIFTSPTPDQMYEAGRAVHSGAGILFIVKNYTGDILNFDMAADMLRADGMEVEQVVINDDVAVKDSLYTAGRRGVGATVLAEKIAGGAAEDGLSLTEVAEICVRVNANARSMGVALTACTVPEAGKTSFDLPEDEYELGIGIHGEPGRERLKLEPADRITERMMAPILEDLPFRSGDEVLLFINNLGGTPAVELDVAYRKAWQMVEQNDLRVVRSLVGTYMTSLDMAGVTITLLKLDETLKKYWDAPANTPAFKA